MKIQRVSSIAVWTLCAGCFDPSPAEPGAADGSTTAPSTTGDLPQTGGSPTSTTGPSTTTLDPTATASTGSSPPPPATTTGTDVDTGSTGTPPPVTEQCDREFVVPSADELQANPALPDPFTFFDGTPVTTRQDWVCRQREISLLAQAFVFGPKPGAPDSIDASFDDDTLSITVTRGQESSQFEVPVDSPGGAAPVPGILSLGGILPGGVAVLDIRGALNQLAQSTGSSGRQNPPQGDFYRLYPENQSTGSLMAWAWTASRIIDALEMTTGHNVDTAALSALGCSRDGKAAATIALFDERFAMVAAQSPGSGTTSGWRVADDVFTGNGEGNVQRARQIYGEDTWMGAVFQPFGQNIETLPVDQHLVLALAWPRPLIMMEGTNDYWNCPYCSYTTLKYTQMVYEALGDGDRISFPQPDHTHCAQAGTFSETYYDLFVDRFLRGDETVSTEGLFTDDNYTFDADRWQDGPVPDLTQ